jgi:selenocysteine-specific elongation factor
MDDTDHFILATAGHVDHGKSSLVKALTGIDPDRLPEEKARGITIDLGFAHLDLEATVNNAPRAFHLGLVDVPGHEDFVKNMVAGVGSIDLALFVVAADDVWMPQTEEHLQILSYLGLRRAVVALTKSDLTGNIEAAIAIVREKLAGSPLAAAKIVPTSVLSGEGIEPLKQALIDVLLHTTPAHDTGKPRLAVDRVFTLRGVGTIVTGTLTGGHFQRGQSVVIRPSGKAARIRTIQSHNKQVDLSTPGTRTALNLPDVEAFIGVKRGDVITLADLGNATDTWEVLLEKSGRPEAGKSTPLRPLKTGSLVRLHIGSANVPSHVHLLDSKTLSAGETALAQLRFESPQFAFIGDRFILRDWSEQATLAGGIILSTDAQRRHARNAENLKLLAARAASPGDPRVFVESQIRREGVVPTSHLLVQSRFSGSEISTAVRQLETEKVLVVAENLVVDAARWQSLRQIAADAIDAVHRAQPDQAGLPLNDLRAKLKTKFTGPEIFDVLLRDLYRNGFIQTGTSIARATHRPALPSHLAGAGAKIRSALSAKPLDPPSRKELAPDAASQQALRFFLQTGEAVALSEEIVLLAANLTRAVQIASEFLQRNGSATASELRQALGTSRRVVIPLLEYLDKRGLTRREGEKRVLKKS